MKKTLHAAALGAAVLSGCVIARDPAPKKTETAQIAGTASVIDGDTLEIHGQRIRLWGIDAPESGQRCTRPDGEAWRCGKDAAMALSDRIGRAPLSCEVKDTDHYGRKVALCRQRGDDLNDWMVREGWAVAYRAYAKAYAGAEEEARAGHRGLWTSRFEMPWDWRKAKAKGKAS